jgi:hypothetical protein
MSGTTFTWTTAADGSWLTHSNWNPSTGGPGVGAGGAATDVAIIDATGATYTVTDHIKAVSLASVTVNSAQATVAEGTNDTLTITGLTNLMAGTIDDLNNGATYNTGTLSIGTLGIFNIGATAVLDVGTSATPGNATIQAGGLLESTTSLGTVVGNLLGTGTVLANAAPLELSSNLNSKTLNFQISNNTGSILQLDGTVTGGNTFTFLGAAGELDFTNSGALGTQNIVGLDVSKSGNSATNFIEVAGTPTVTGGFEGTGTSGTFTLSNGDTFTLTGITEAGNPATTPWFVNTKVVGAFTDISLNVNPCYAAGTRILAATGERMIESLMKGDIVLTLSGSELQAQPIKWVGRRRVDLIAHPRPETVAPIRIGRGAFADDMPHTDLVVSPDHAIFVDGKLICARQLVNGTTIRQERGWTSVDYFHVELDAHAILLAEGLPAESYLNTGNHGFFANSGEPLVLHPDLTDETGYPTREAGSCAPFVWDEANVRPVWQRLADRAAAIGQPVPQTATTTEANLCVRGRKNHGKLLYADSNLVLFVLPRGEKDFRLVSRAQSPTEARPWIEDRRRLGVQVKRIVLRGADELQEVPLDHPSLTKGWWAVERDGQMMSRWTDGNAVLKLPERLSSNLILEIHLAGAMTYVVEAERVAA